MGDAYVVGAVRSPIGKKKGKLSGFHPTDLLGTVLRGLLERTGVDPLQIDDVIGGCGGPTRAQGGGGTRQAWGAARLPRGGAGPRGPRPGAGLPPGARVRA